MSDRIREGLRQYLREERRRLNMIEDLIDQNQELERDVAHWRARYDILIEAKTEASNEQEAYGSSNLDK